MAKAWVLFGKSIESGKVEAAGIEIKDTNGQLLESNVILGNTADKFASMEDGVKKNTLAVSLFGRSGAALLPFLSKGSAGVTDLKAKMDELGVSFDEAGLEKVKNYTKAQRELSASMEGLKFTVGEGLTPVITAFTKTVSEDIPKVTAAIGEVAGVIGKVVDTAGLGGIADGLGRAAPAAAVFATAIVGVGAAIVVLGPAVSAGIGVVTGFAGAVANAGRAVTGYAGQLAFGTVSTQSFVAAQEGATVATTGLSTAAGVGMAAGVAVGVLALKHYGDSINGLRINMQQALGQTNAQAVETAHLLDSVGGQGRFEEAGRQNIALLYNMRDALAANGEKLPHLEAAIKKVEAENARAAAAQAKANQETEAGGEAAEQAATMADKMTAALSKETQGLGDATAKSIAYKLGLDDLVAAQTALAAQDGKVNEAVVAVAEAHDKATQAAEDLTSAEEAATQADRSVVDAKKAVGDAIDAVADARRAEEANVRSLAEAQKAEAESVADITEAEQDLATARREATGDSDAMRSALEKVADAEEALRKADDDSTAAQQRLTDARNNYQNVLSSLADQKLSAEVGVRDAERALRDAQQAVADLGIDGKPVSADDRGAATDAVIKAEIALRRAKLEAAEAAAELNKEEQAGRDGSTAVVAAQNDVTAAADRRTEANESLEDAVQNVADTQVAANANVAAAEQTLAEKIDARQAAHQRVLDAKQSVVDGQKAIQGAVAGVATAEQGVADAATNAGKAHQEVVDKKGAIVTAANEIATAEYGVNLALAAQLALRQALNNLTATAPPGYQVGAQHAPNEGNSRERSASGGKGRAGKSSTAGKGQTRGVSGSTKPQPGGKPPRPDEDYEPDKGTPPGEAGTVTGQPSDAMNADMHAAALGMKADLTGRHGMRKRNGSHTFHINVHGASDPIAAATAVARKVAFEFDMAGVH